MLYFFRYTLYYMYIFPLHDACPCTYATLRTCLSFLFRSGAHCFFTIIREEGVRGLYHGLSVNLVRGVGGAILLVGYDEAKALLKGSETLI
jgi:Mitochondrial carrier protein